MSQRLQVRFQSLTIITLRRIAEFMLKHTCAPSCAVSFCVKVSTPPTPSLLSPVPVLAKILGHARERHTHGLHPHECLHRVIRVERRHVRHTSRGHLAWLLPIISSASAPTPPGLFMHSATLTMLVLSIAIHANVFCIIVSSLA